MNCYKLNCNQTELLKKCSTCGKDACIYHRVPGKKTDASHCEDCFNLGGLNAVDQTPVDLFTEYEDLIFLYNWNNKLDSKRFFTSIRLYNPSKYKVGIIYRVREAKELKTGWEDLREPLLAKIVSEAIFLIDKLPVMTAALDTGYTREETIAMMKTMYGADSYKQFAAYLLDKKVEPLKKD